MEFATYLMKAAQQELLERIQLHNILTEEEAAERLDELRPYFDWAQTQEPDIMRAYADAIKEIATMLRDRAAVIKHTRLIFEARATLPKPPSILELKAAQETQELLTHNEPL